MHRIPRLILRSRLLQGLLLGLLLVLGGNIYAQTAGRYRLGQYSVTGSRATLTGGRYTVEVVAGRYNNDSATGGQYTNNPGLPLATPTTNPDQQPTATSIPPTATSIPPTATANPSGEQQVVYLPLVVR